MNTRGKLPIFLILLLSITIVGIWVLYSVYYAPNARISATYLEVYQEIDPLEVDSLELRSINHKLIIKESEGDKIRINYFQKTDNINTYNSGNGVVSLNMRERVENLDNLFFQSSRKIDTITVYVPTECRTSIRYDTIGGTSEISNVTLSNLEVSSITSGIEIKNSEVGTITFNTNEGNIFIDEVVFDSLNVTEISGTVNLDVDDSLGLYRSAVSTTYGILNINGERVKDKIEEVETVVNYYNSEPEEAVKEINISAARSNININSVEPEPQPETPEEPAEQPSETTEQQ